MPTLNGDRVPYGNDSLVPVTSKTAWGARLIVDQDGYVDFLPDRQGAAGEDRDAFFDLLERYMSPTVLKARIAGLLGSGEMSTRVAQDFLILANERLEIHANTNASAGYCYVTAWTSEGNST